MAAEMVERLRRPADAYRAGDPEPFVALLDEHVEWRGRRRGRLWWSHTPS
jgi:hypothetical protein